MLPKNHLGREYYKRLFIYSEDKIPFSENLSENQAELEKNWIKINL